MWKIGALVLGAAIFSSHASFAQTEVIIGADNPGGSYYLYGGGLSTWINEHSKTLRATAQTTRGSVENARLLASARIGFGLVNAIAAYQQRHGVGQFENQQSDKLAGIAALDTAPLHIIVYASSGIRSLADLAGKRVSIGAPGSGSATTANALFPIIGLVGKVKALNLGFSESASSLRDSNLDVVFAASALPMPAAVDLASSGHIALIEIPAPIGEDLQKKNPFYEISAIPGNTYNGVTNDVHTVSVASLLVARNDIPDDVVYELVSQMYAPDSLSYMRNVYRAWDPHADQQLFTNIGVPLHPGALRYYREHGSIK